MGDDHDDVIFRTPGALTNNVADVVRLHIQSGGREQLGEIFSAYGFMKWRSWNFGDARLLVGKGRGGGGKLGQRLANPRIGGQVGRGNASASDGVSRG